MNKVFPYMQSKDKDISTGRYTHTNQETRQVAPARKSGWSPAAVCLGLIVIAVLAALLL